MDYLTKWPEAKPLKQVKAIDVAKFLFKEIICSTTHQKSFFSLQDSVNTLEQ
ncbi:839_t:CDS:1, partial [Funneliformis geosporum]